MGVAIVVVSHSAPLALAAVALAREMAPADRVRIEVAAGTDDGGTGTDATAIMAALEACATDSTTDGVLVLLDLGSAVLSAETALDLLDPDASASTVRLSPAPLVEGLVVAAVAAAAGRPLDDVAAEAEGALGAKAVHLGHDLPSAPHEAETTADVTADVTDAVTATFTVHDPQGLHARPVARLVAATAELDAEVALLDLTSGTGPVDASSPLAVMTLGSQLGHEIEVRATGPDAQTALDRLLASVAADLADEDG